MTFSVLKYQIILQKMLHYAHVVLKASTSINGEPGTCFAPIQSLLKIVTPENVLVFNHLHDTLQTAILPCHLQFVTDCSTKHASLSRLQQGFSIHQCINKVDVSHMLYAPDPIWAQFTIKTTENVGVSDC
jgi:hypothetical protein